MKSGFDVGVVDTGVAVPYEFFPRRAGDIAVSYADTSLAELTMGWKAHFNLEDMCKVTWRWQSMNLKGYHKSEHNISFASQGAYLAF